MDADDVRLVLESFELTAMEHGEEYCNHWEQPQDAVKWALGCEILDDRQPHFDAYLRLKAALGDEL